MKSRHDYLLISIPTNSGGSLLHAYIARCADVIGIWEKEAHWVAGDSLPAPRDYAKYRRLFTLGDQLTAYSDRDRYNYDALWARFHRSWRALDPARYATPGALLSTKSTMGAVLLPHIAEALRARDPSARIWWIVGMRDPYAFCEGVRRREGHAVTLSARHWLKTAELQQALVGSAAGACVRVNYEALADTPERVQADLRAFHPALADLAMDGAVEKPAVGGPRAGFVNMNTTQRGRLSAQQIEEISAVVATRRDLLQFWGYA